MRLICIVRSPSSWFDYRLLARCHNAALTSLKALSRSLLVLEIDEAVAVVDFNIQEVQ